MKYLGICLLVVAVVGCSEPPKPRYDEKLRGQVRLQIFNQCLEAASKITRQGDDDVSDIVKECGNQSYYLSNQLSEIVE